MEHNRAESEVKRCAYKVPKFSVATNQPSSIQNLFSRGLVRPPRNDHPCKTRGGTKAIASDQASSLEVRPRTPKATGLHVLGRRAGAQQDGLGKAFGYHPSIRRSRRGSNRPWGLITD
eukprot:scaffold11005_cov25-Tisochrysis_lutea.AAC.7